MTDTSATFNSDGSYLQWGVEIYFVHRRIIFVGTGNLQAGLVEVSYNIHLLYNLQIDHLEAR